MVTGIYALYWQEQDLVYIGQSQNIEARFKEHLNKMGKGTHTNYKVQNSYNLYGKPELVILEEAIIDKLNDLEILWTREFDSINKGLNIVEAGQVGWGVNSNASKYTKRQILKVFSLLYRTRYKPEIIANRAKVSVSVVEDILYNRSHFWLSQTYPEKYELLKTREPYALGIANKLGIVPKVISPEGRIYSVPSIRGFCREHPLLSSAPELTNVGLARVIAGTRKQYKGWRLFKENPEQN